MKVAKSLLHKIHGWRKIGIQNKAELSILEGAGHGGPQFDCEENLRDVYDFLDRILKL